MSVVNEALGTAMASSGHTCETLASATGIDPKTIRRWIHEGRRPHAGNAAKVAAELGVEVGELWPELAPNPGIADGQVVHFWPHRSLVPGRFWQALTERATQRIWVATYASAFFGESAEIGLIKAKAASGVSVRMTLGDPDCEQVAIRTYEERMPIADRIRMALGYYSELVGAPGVDFRLHGTVLYNTVMVFDDDVVLNQHIYGAKGFEAPILHLNAAAPGDLAQMYLRSFERVWEESRPYEPTKTGPRDLANAIASNAA